MALGSLLYKLKLDTSEFVQGSAQAKRKQAEIGDATEASGRRASQGFADMATGLNQAWEIGEKLLDVIKKIGEESERQARGELNAATQALITGTSLAHSQAVQALSVQADIPERALFDIREGLESKLAAQRGKDFDPLLQSALDALGIDQDAYGALGPEQRDEYILDRIAALPQAADKSEQTFGLGEVFAGDSEDVARLALLLSGTGGSIASEREYIESQGLTIGAEEPAEAARILQAKGRAKLYREEVTGEAAQNFGTAVDFAAETKGLRSTELGGLAQILSFFGMGGGGSAPVVNVTVDEAAHRAGVRADISDVLLNDEATTPASAVHRGR